MIGRQAVEVAIVAGLMILWDAADTHAFHAGGSAGCEGCHTIHNSQGGKGINGTPQFQAGMYLLQGSDQSSVCLNCHQGSGISGPSEYHVSTATEDMPQGVPPNQLPPGGDFGWLKKSYTWTDTTFGPRSSSGDHHGHNIIAADYKYEADKNLQSAPGGTYPAANLHCTSCHDPHGKYRRNADGSITTTGLPILGSGSYSNSPDPTSSGAVGVYRMLAGFGYQPKSLSGSYSFVNSPPAAVAPPDYNRSEGAIQTRVAYGKGMSEWCANCHASLHRGSFTSGQSGLAHPAGDDAKLGAGVASNYKAYVKTGNMSGQDSSSYLSLVPFEEGVADYASLKANAVSDGSRAGGPDYANANVSCMSCHRAHATGWDAILRFNNSTEFVTVADSSGNSRYADPSFDPNQAQGRMTAETQKAYYDRPPSSFAPYQRTLCNKCHAKD